MGAGLTKDLADRQKRRKILGFGTSVGLANLAKWRSHLGKLANSTGAPKPVILPRFWRADKPAKS